MLGHGECWLEGKRALKNRRVRWCRASKKVSVWKGGRHDIEVQYRRGEDIVGAVERSARRLWVKSTQAFWKTVGVSQIGAIGYVREYTPPLGYHMQLNFAEVVSAYVDIVVVGALVHIEVVG